MKIMCTTYLIAIDSTNKLVAVVKDHLSVVVAYLVSELRVVGGRLHVVDVTFERVLHRDAKSLLVVFFLVHLGVLHHSFDLDLTQAACGSTVTHLA